MSARTAGPWTACIWGSRSSEQGATPRAASSSTGTGTAAQLGEPSHASFLEGGQDTQPLRGDDTS